MQRWLETIAGMIHGRILEVSGAHSVCHFRFEHVELFRKSLPAAANGGVPHGAVVETPLATGRAASDEQVAIETPGATDLDDDTRASRAQQR